MPAIRLRDRLLVGAILIGAGALLAACAGRDTQSLDEARSAVSEARTDQTVLEWPAPFVVPSLPISYLC